MFHFSFLVLQFRKPTLDTANILHLDIGSSITVNCHGFRDVVDLKWVQKRAGDVEVEVSKKLLINDGIFEVEGEKRRVLALYIRTVGPGSYGLYSCKQTLNQRVLATDLYLRPKKEEEESEEKRT